MKTRKIGQETFEAIRKRSHDNIRDEICKASNKLRKAFKKKLKVENINDDYVVFASEDNPNIFLKARYRFTENDTIKFNNFEKIILDESSKQKSRKKILKNMINSLQNDDNESANESWEELMYKFPITEMVKKKAAKTGHAPGDSGCFNADEEDQERQGKIRSSRKSDGRYGSLTSTSDELMTLKAVDPCLEEYAHQLPNYISSMKYLIEALKDTDEIVGKDEVEDVKIKKKNKKDKYNDDENEDIDDDIEDEDDKDDEDEDDKDDEDEDDEDDEDKDEDEEIDEVEVDTKDKDNKKKSMGVKSKKHRVKVHAARNKFSKKEKDSDFSDKIVQIKRDNNMGDGEAIEEALIDIVAENPEIIYVSKDELSSMISRILESRGESGYDFYLCEDIAIGLRKLAHKIYNDQAYDIAKYCAIDEVVSLDEEVSDDDYEAFEEISSRYYEDIYDRANKQFKVINNLYETIEKVADILESEAENTEIIKDKEVQQLILEYRKIAGRIKSNPFNENLVKNIVGSLLTRVQNDYTLNQLVFKEPCHFRDNIDLDKNDYEKLTKKSTKDSYIGDEEMYSYVLSDKYSLKEKEFDPNKLDLFNPDKYKDFNVMKNGVVQNPMAPKSLDSRNLDLS